MKRVATNDGQFLFDNNLRGLAFFARIAFASLIFSPVLFTGYWLAMKFVARGDSALVWIIATLLFSAMIYVVLQIIKTHMVKLRRQGNWFWLALFILFVGFVCVPPVLITLPWALYLTHRNQMIAWMLEIAFALFIYRQYELKINRN